MADRGRGGGHGRFALLAVKARQARALQARAEAVLTAPKDIGTFTFGSDRPGPPGAVERPLRFPVQIGFVWRLCVGAWGA